jgi:hypothetical protein
MEYMGILAVVLMGVCCIVYFGKVLYDCRKKKNIPNEEVANKEIIVPTPEAGCRKSMVRNEEAGKKGKEDGKMGKGAKEGGKKTNEGKEEGEGAHLLNGAAAKIRVAFATPDESET